MSTWTPTPLASATVPVNVGADPVPLDKVARRDGSENVDAITVARDQIARARRCAANRIPRCRTAMSTPTPLASASRTGDIGADEVPLDQIVRGT